MRRLALFLVLATAASSARGESLYSEKTFRALAADKRACRAGDVLTVHVFENSQAVSTTDTSTRRRNGIDASVGLIEPNRQAGVRLGVAGEFSGGGATQRANRLLATLAVSVRDVGVNGDLYVVGEQLLTVNDEQHRVKISGRVRPQDVSSDNVVLSTRIADATIEYTGDGHLTDRQRRSLWRAVLDWLGL